MSWLDTLTGFLGGGNNTSNTSGGWGKNIVKYGLPLALIYAQSRADDSDTLGKLFGSMSAQPKSGYQGGIDRRIATRNRIPQPVDPNRRPGQNARQHFGQTTYAPKPAGMAAGGLAFLAAGGPVSSQMPPRFLDGPTDGMADRIPANIDGQQEAALSDGEFVWPADVVSHLGNGNSSAGAQVLYNIVERIREARTGNPEQAPPIDPNKFFPVGGNRNVR